MGQYFFTFVYRGELIDIDKVPIKKWSKSKIINKTKKLYYDNYVNVGSIDTIIEKHEINQGYVNLSEILNLINKNEEIKNEFGKIVDDDFIFICQGEWWSLDDDHSLSINYNLPCINIVL